MQRQKSEKLKKGAVRSAKESAYIAVFVALVIAAQLLLSFLAGIELVTVLFVAFCYAFGIRMGAIAATAFSLLRNFIFGLFPSVLILYLAYYNLLAVLFGGLGKIKFCKTPWRFVLFVLIACLCTVAFTMLDNVITPLWYGYVRDAWIAYFWASFASLIPQIVCTAVTVGTLFYPLNKAFLIAKRGL